MSMVNGFQVGSDVLKYNYEALENYNTPNYSSSSTYNVGDYVMYLGKLYKCITDIGTAEDWNSSKWELSVLSDDVRSLSEDIEKLVNDFTDEYDSSSGTYDVGDVVIYDKVLKRCIYKISTPENWNSSHWTTINIYDLIKQIYSNLAEEYDSTKTYSINEYVIYSGQLYRCVSSITVPEEWHSNKWNTIDLSSVLYNNVNTLTRNISLALYNAKGNMFHDFLDYKTVAGSGNNIHLTWIKNPWDTASISWSGLGTATFVWLYEGSVPDCMDYNVWYKIYFQAQFGRVQFVTQLNGTDTVHTTNDINFKVQSGDTIKIGFKIPSGSSSDSVSLGMQYNYSVLTSENKLKAYISSPYDSTATYSIGDYAFYRNVLYKCVTTISTPEAFNASHWEETTIGDELVEFNDNVVRVTGTQPSSPYNHIWVNPSNNEVEIPTMDEFDELKSAIDQAEKVVQRFVPCEYFIKQSAIRLLTDGTVSGTGLSSHVGIYHVEPGQHIKLKLNTVANSAVYQFQSVQSLITSDTTKIVGDTIATATDDIVTVPSGANALCVCQMNDSVYTVDFCIDSTTKTDVTVLVGGTGLFVTVNRALTYLRSLYRLETVQATIELDSGFRLAEQIVSDAVNDSWISIYSSASYVTVTASAISETTVSVPAHSPYSAVILSAIFTAKNNGVLPKIKALFKVDSANNTTGIALYNGGRAYIADGCGVTYATSGIYLIEHGYANAMGADFSHAVGNCISCFRSSSIIFGGGTATDAGYDGIYVDSNSNAEVSGADFSRAAENGIEVGPACLVQAQLAKADGCKIGCYAYNGGIVSGREFHATNCTVNAIKAQTGARISLPVSTLTGTQGRGIYVQSGSEVNLNGSNFSGATNIGCEVGDGSLLRMVNANARRGENDSTNDIIWGNGSIVIAYGATGGTFRTVNEITAQGLCIK